VVVQDAVGDAILGRSWRPLLRSEQNLLPLIQLSHTPDAESCNNALRGWGILFTGVAICPNGIRCRELYTWNLIFRPVSWNRAIGRVRPYSEFALPN